MYLERIRLVGFKSFARPTEISPHRRLTAVVGPNGCGKSNLFDAIRWVLGERSSGSLRGEEMADIIFCGSNGRGATAMAEVTVCFAECQKVLGPEYPQLAITRRLFRDGTGEYEINGRTCRLRDIQWLLLNTGLGTHGYSMVTQNQVDRVLFASPEERRELVEEAAGIARYRWERRDAKRRLEEVERDLALLGERLAELSAQGEALRKKAEKARRERQLRDRIRVLELTVAREALRKHRARLAQLEGRCQELRRQEEAIVREAQGSRTQWEELRAEHQRLRERRQELYGKLQELRKAEQEQAKALAEAWRELGSASQREAALEERERNARATLTEVLQKLSRMEEEQMELLAAKPGEGEEPESSRGKEDNLEELCNALEKEGHELKGFSLWIEEREREALEKSGRMKGEAEKLAFFREELAERLAFLEKARKELLREEEEARARILEVQGRLQEREASVLQAEEAGKRLLETLEGMRRKEEELLRRLAGLEAEAKGLGRWIAGGQLGSRESLAGSLGSVWEGIEVEPGYERAIAALLGAWAQAKVVPNKQSLADVAGNTAVGEPGGLWVALEAKEKQDEPETLPVAACRLVRWKQGWEKLGHLLDKTLVVEDWRGALELARSFPGYRVATRDGWVWEGAGLCLRKEGGGENPWILQRELEAVREEEQRLFKERKDLQEERRGVEGRSRQLQEELERQKGELARLREELAQWKRKSQELERRQRALAEEEERWRNKGEAWAGQGKAWEEAVKELEKEKELLGELRRCCRRWEEQWRERMEQAVQQRKALQEREEARERMRVLWAERLRRFVTEKEALERRRESLQEEAVRVERERTILAERRLSWQERVENLRRAEQEVLAQRAALEEKWQEAEALGPELARQEEQERQRWEGLLARRQELAERRQRQELERAKEEVLLQELEGELRERYGSLGEELHHPGGRDRDEEVEGARRELEKLRAELQSLGPVDPSALLELQDWEERFTFLESQKKDLWEAKEMLCQALADMDRQARDRLGQALGRLQVEFQELCRRLMGGGEGSLELVGSEDILEAGLEVRVRPPGKQLRTLALLSGGERALSALAFLFALHRVRPSPLCLLDEVDAPLDDANVERLLGVLRELAGESQFLMVTHHPRSVAEADAVLGITMGEEGISTVLGLPWDRFGAREK